LIVRLQRYTSAYFSFQKEYKASLEDARHKIESLNTSITELKMNPASNAKVLVLLLPHFIVDELVTINPLNEQNAGGDGSIFGELISVISPKPTKKVLTNLGCYFLFR